MHVWRCAVPSPAGLATLQARLAAGERERAAQLRHEGARGRYIVARAALRELAASYLDADPMALRFAAGAGGKPSLAAPHAASGLRFNLSHSGTWALLAFSRDGEVGVDLEPVARAVAWWDLARRYFSPPEAAALAALPPTHRRRSFMIAWCCKEALAKVSGTGLLAALGTLAVPIPLGPRPVVIAGPSGRAGLLQRLTPAPGYTGALATAVVPRAVRRLEWRPQAG